MEKDIFEKVEKCPLYFAFILIFYLQNGNIILKKIRRINITLLEKTKNLVNSEN